jgi:hypothetical protein
VSGTHGHLAIDPDQLRAHAGTLAGYADRLSAIGTGLPDSLADQSLGSFAQFLTTGLGGAMTETLNAFGHAGSTVDMMAGGVRAAADSYQRTDDDNVTTLTNAGEGR